MNPITLTKPEHDALTAAATGKPTYNSHCPHSVRDHDKLRASKLIKILNTPGCKKIQVTQLGREWLEGVLAQ